MEFHNRMLYENSRYCPYCTPYRTHTSRARYKEKNAALEAIVEFKESARLRDSFFLGGIACLKVATPWDGHHLELELDVFRAE